MLGVANTNIQLEMKQSDSVLWVMDLKNGILDSVKYDFQSTYLYIYILQKFSLWVSIFG